MFDVENLIDLIKERPYLYDLTDPDYKNRAKRMQAWKEITEALRKGNPSFWNAKWKGLKDNYSKYKKNSDPVYGDTYRKYKNWPWAEHMKFIDECNVRRPDTRDKSDLNVSNIHLIIADPNTNCSNTVPEADPVPEVADYNIEIKKRKINNSSETDDGTEYVKIKKSEEKPLDGVDHFFLSYAQSFKQLPSRMQIMLKLEIATLFSRYELQAEGVSNESVGNIPRVVRPIKCELDVTNTIIDEEC